MDNVTRDSCSDKEYFFEVESRSQYDALQKALELGSDGFYFDYEVVPLSCGVRTAFGKIYHVESEKYLLDVLTDKIIINDDLNF